MGCSRCPLVSNAPESRFPPAFGEPVCRPRPVLVVRKDLDPSTTDGLASASLTIAAPESRPCLELSVETHRVGDSHLHTPRRPWPDLGKRRFARPGADRRCRPGPRDATTASHRGRSGSRGGIWGSRSTRCTPPRLREESDGFGDEPGRVRLPSWSMARRRRRVRPVDEYLQHCNPRAILWPARLGGQIRRGGTGWHSYCSRSEAGAGELGGARGAYR